VNNVQGYWKCDLILSIVTIPEKPMEGKNTHLSSITLKVIMVGLEMVSGSMPHCFQKIGGALICSEAPVLWKGSKIRVSVSVAQISNLESEVRTSRC
jgi:hypothetical protein